MSKGLDKKKEQKKKPAKSLQEKRAEKRAKRESRGCCCRGQAFSLPAGCPFRQVFEAW